MTDDTQATPLPQQIFNYGFLASLLLVFVALLLFFGAGVGRNSGAILAYSLLGFAAGYATNQVNKALDSRLPRVYGKAWAAIALKLCVIAVFAANAEALFRQFVLQWQGTTPGLFFVSLFFGMQTSLMEDVTAVA